MNRESGFREEPLDWTSFDLMRNLRNGESLVRATIRNFLANATADLDAIHRGAAEGRWADVGRSAHRLLGSSGVLGVVQVAAVCRAIEGQVRAGVTDELAPLVARLKEELERARAALEQAATRGGGD